MHWGALIPVGGRRSIDSYVKARPEVRMAPPDSSQRSGNSDSVSIHSDCMGSLGAGSPTTFGNGSPVRIGASYLGFAGTVHGETNARAPRPPICRRSPLVTGPTP